MTNDLKTDKLKRQTPQQQLWKMLDQKQRTYIGSVFRRLKKRDQEDLCYATIAFLRFKIRRKFDNPFMQGVWISILMNL